MREICPNCEGTGREYGTEKKCPNCIDGGWEAQYWYFTFPYGHQYANMYIKFLGTKETARNKMVFRFGLCFFQYDEATFLPQIEKYSLKELT